MINNLSDALVVIKEQAKKIENLRNSYYIGTVTVTKERERDEYWGYWETCDKCKSSTIEGSIFCPNCGGRIIRGKL